MIDTYTNERSLLGEDSPTILSQYQYAYDDNGNISKIKDKNGNTVSYDYDDLDQLVRVNDQKAGTSTTYSYDAGGNITEAIAYPYTTGTLGTPLKNGTETYDYGDDDWKDLLTSYNGQGISYDNIGNPLDYRDGMEFTWEGRQLKTAVADDTNLSYTYNSDGIRTSKAAGGATTTYFLDGSTIMAQKSGSDVIVVRV
ncbi:RHS repeat domain-containing protein [Caproiciproducens sp.]